MANCIADDGYVRWSAAELAWSSRARALNGGDRSYAVCVAGLVHDHYAHSCSRTLAMLQRRYPPSAAATSRLLYRIRRNIGTDGTGPSCYYCDLTLKRSAQWCSQIRHVRVRVQIHSFQVRIQLKSMFTVLIATRRSQHSQECNNPRRQCFLWLVTLTFDLLNPK